MKKMIDCFEVTPHGISRVSVSAQRYATDCRFLSSIEGARAMFKLWHRGGQKPRVAPRTAVGVVVSP